MRWVPIARAQCCWRTCTISFVMPVGIEHRPPALGGGGCIELLHVGSLLENWSFTTVKYGCNRAIFVATPSNSNNMTLVKSGSK
jgi:hypothetical protein